MPLLSLFKTKNYEKLQKTITSKAQGDIDQPNSSSEADTIKDLNRCGDLYFQTPNGEILTAPNQQDDPDNGKKRLQWLVEQINKFHQGPMEEKEAIINHIKQYAHQAGFLFAGRNGIAEIMNSKNIVPIGSPHYLSSAFSLRNNEFSYIERYDLSAGFVSTDEVFTSTKPLATLVMRSIMTFDAMNEEKPITQEIESLDITINDELALNIFSDRTDSSSQILEKEKNLKEVLKPGFFGRLIESISSLFQRKNEESSNKPKT